MEVWTIGHSNHSFEKFLGLLQQHKISMLVDVRSRPSSRFTHFIRDNLIRGVRENGIDYRYGGNVLGGMGSQLGVILAAVVMILLPELAREFNEYRMLMFGALMVLMMIWRPQGLLPMQRPHLEVRR